MPSHINTLDLLLHFSLAGLLILLFATLLTHTLLRRSSSAARHLTWTAACLALLCLPPFTLLPSHPNLPPYLPSIPPLPTLPALHLDPPPPSNTPLPSSPLHPSSFSLHPFLLPLYLLGLLASLTPLLAALILLRRLRRQSIPVINPTLLSTLDDCRRTLDLSRPVALFLSPSPDTMPLAFGLLRPGILLPSTAATWPTDKLRLILSHELAHIKRHDCLTQTLAQLARAIHWFNPLACLALWRMRTERERACDDLVLRATSTRPSDYADTLLHLTSSLRPAPAFLPAMPMARPSHLHTRLRDILNPGLNRSPLTRRLTIAAILLAPAIALPLSCSRSEKPYPAPPAPSDQTVDQYGWTPEMNACQGPMRDITLAAGKYTNEHNGHLPPTLGDTLPYIDRNSAMTRTDHRHATPAEKAKMYLDPRDYAAVTIPDAPTPDWVNTHASYTYLGRADVAFSSLTDDEHGKTVLLHDNLDHPHHHPKRGPTIIVAYLDGHADALPLPDAQKLIASSKETLANAAKRAPAISNPQAAIQYPKSLRPIPFDLGDSSFLPGDSIKIDRVLNVPIAQTNNRKFIVTGTYTLASHDSAILGCYITSSDPFSGTGSTTPITKGTAPFSLSLTLAGQGYPHVSFYPIKGGNSFGGVYFGSGPTLLKQQPASGKSE